MSLFISEEFKKIFGFISNIEPLQQSQVFVSEALLSVVLLLIANVPNHRIQLRMRVRECTEAFLPIEPSSDPAVTLNEFSRIRLNVSHQIRERDAGLEADQHMSVIRHGVYLDQLLSLFPNDARDVFLKLFLEVWSDEALPHGNSKDCLDVINMALLAEGGHLDSGFYEHGPPDGGRATSSTAQ
jgi:hypothetical protein